MFAFSIELVAFAALVLVLVLRLARLERAVASLQATAAAPAAAHASDEIPAEILVEIHLAVLGLLPEQRAASATAAAQVLPVPARAPVAPLLVAPFAARSAAVPAAAPAARPNVRPERSARSSRPARGPVGLPRKRAREPRSSRGLPLLAPRVALG